jgi:UDP-glucose 4-epimerase
MSRDGVLLLGGGFIGMALARRLLADGKKVHVVTHSIASDIDAGISVHLGDLSDADLLEKLSSECSTIVHLASVTLPGSSARHPVRELDNLAPTLRLLEALQSWESTHVIFLSSGGTVYGNPLANPVAETAPLVPLSYYGAGKVALESFFHAARSAGQMVTVLRPSNVYGPGQNLRTGFGLIRTLLEHVRNKVPVEIWGDGENIRDFVYIDDLVEGCKRFIDMPTDSGTYNLGSGVGHSINQVLRTIETICETNLQKMHRPARKMDVREVVLDMSNLEARLDWRPAMGLEEGVRRTWMWILGENEW